MSGQSIPILIILVFFTLTTFSQEDDPVLFRLDEKDIVEGVESSRQEVVSASRSARYAEDLPVTVWVVTREEIIQNGYNSLVDVLKSVPGIRVSQPGSGTEGETFLLRGLFGNYYTKILIDNIPIQPSVVSGMPIANQLPVKQAERIEIIFGPASAIYGADAMAGVINIITKTSERPVYAQADIGFGSYGYYYMNALIGGKIGKNKNVMKYKFYGNAGFRNDMNVKYDIQDLYNPSVYDSTYAYLNAPYYKGDSTTPDMGRLPQLSQLLGMSMLWRGFRLSYDNMYRSTHSSIGLSTDRYAYYNPHAMWAERIHRLAAGYDHSWSKLSSTTNLSFLRYRLNNLSQYSLIYDGGTGGNAYKYAASDDLLFEQLVTVELLRDLELTAGFSFQYSGNLPKTNDLAEPFDTDNYQSFSNEQAENDTAFENFGINPLTFSNTAGFLQLFYLYKRFTFIAGGRYDYHSMFGGSLNPRIAVLFEIDKEMSLRASFGTAYRAPSTYYTYNSIAYQTTEGISYQAVPNPDLDPEKFNSAEIGYRYRVSAKFNMDLALFTHFVDERTSLSVFPLDPDKYPDAINPGGLSTAFVNDANSQARLFGIQANFRFRDIVGAGKLNTDVYISLAKGKEVLPNNFGNLDNYRMMPLVYTQLNLFYKPVPEVYIGFENIFSSKWYRRFFPLEPGELEKRGFPATVDGYYRLDIIARFIFNENFQAFFDLNNVFNAYYGGISASGTRYDLIYNPQYGRNYMFGLSFKIE